MAVGLQALHTTLPMDLLPVVSKKYTEKKIHFSTNWLKILKKIFKSVKFEIRKDFVIINWGVGLMTVFYLPHSMMATLRKVPQCEHLECMLQRAPEGSWEE